MGSGSEGEDFDQLFGSEEEEQQQQLQQEGEKSTAASNEDELSSGSEEDEDEEEEEDDSDRMAVDNDNDDKVPPAKVDDDSFTAVANQNNISIKTIKTPSERGLIPYLLKLPGFIACRKEAFTGEAQLRAELAEAGEFCDYSDLLRSISTIRTAAAGSNARFNRWSDGSWTLQIGAQHFEVCPQSFRPDEHNLLFARHAEASCLEASARLANKLTVKPFMDAIAGSHRKYLALAEATGKGMKVTKVRVAPTTVDPEKQKQALVKMQQERIRAQRKLDAKRRNLEQKAYDRVGREGLSGRFLEEGDDDDDEYWEKRGDGNGSSGEDEYDADFIDDGELVQVEDDDNDNEDEGLHQSSAAASRTSRLIFDDDDDDD